MDQDHAVGKLIFIRAVSLGHRIRCHIPIEELKQVEEIFRSAALE